MSEVTGSGIQHIERLVSQAASHKYIVEPGTKNQIILDKDGGVLNTVVAQYNCTADTLKGFCSLFHELLSYSTTTVNRPLVSVSRSKIIGVADSNDKFQSDKIIMDLEATREWNEIISCVGGRSFGIRSLNKWLNINFPESPMKLSSWPMMKQIRWVNDSGAVHAINHGQDEMSSSSKNKAVNGNNEELPEHCILDCSIFHEMINESTKPMIKMCVDYDHNTKEIVLAPVAEQIESALRQTMSASEDFVRGYFQSENIDIKVVADAMFSVKAPE